MSGAEPDRRLAELTWTELTPQSPGHERSSPPRPQPLLAVPLGSCEQHGPHLPLDTDTRLAEAFAKRLAQTRGDTLIAPSIAIGASGEHSDFAGTLSIGTAALSSVLVELARSALPREGSSRPSPFSAVLFVNAHGGNLDAVTNAVGLLRRESRRVAAWHPRVDNGDPHAGCTETSLMLHLHPARVRMDLAEPGSTARFSEILGEVTCGGLAEVSPSGVLGDPTSASAQTGAALFAMLTEQLSRAAHDLLDHDPDRRHDI